MWLEPVMAHHPTRERLLHAAAQLLWERSFHATGVDELCLAAGAMKGSFYHFFPSKTALAVEALEQQWATTRARVFEAVAASDRRGLDRLALMVEKMEEIQAGAMAGRNVFLGSPFGNLGQETGHQDESLRSTVHRIFDNHCRYLVFWLDEAERDWQIPPGDNRQRAVNILALLEGGLLLAKVAGDPAVFRRVAESVCVIAGKPRDHRGESLPL